MAEDGGTISGDRLTELDAFPHRLVAPREQLTKALPALLDCLRPNVRAPSSSITSYATRIAAAWPCRERKPSKSDVLSRRSRMASPSSTALSTGSAATAWRMRVKVFE
jgi:hypothetical protein